MDAASAVLTALLSLPQWGLDRLEAEERYAAYPSDVRADLVELERRELYRPVAEVIVEVGEGPVEWAFLVTQGWHETLYARYVLEERCHEGPVGARCDDGLATGPWQVHPWCTGAFDVESTYRERLAAGARCSLQGYRRGAGRCGGSYAGAFAEQVGRYLTTEERCEQDWALARAETMIRVLEVL